MKQLYTGANVFCSEQKKFEENVSVVCSDGKIEQVVKGPMTPQSGMEVVDVRGKWMIPGMINVHEHQTYKRLVGPLFGMQGSFFQVTEAGLTMRAIRSSLYSLRKGITTILEAGAPGNVPFTMRDAIRKKVIPGPRMFIVGAAFSITGGHGCELCHEVDSPDEMRKEVRRSFQSGVDAIKILASEEPVESVGSEPVIAQMSEEMIRTAVEEAHNVHKKVSIHAMGTEQLARSIRAGVDLINHGAFMGEELAVQMKEQGIIYVPTLSSYRLTAHPRFERGEVWGRGHEQLWPAFDAAVRAALNAGVSMAVGTDSVGDFHHELKMLHRRGMTREDCIIAATLNGARAVGAERLLGSIEEGKYADFVILDGNPLENLDALDNVELVVKAGDVYTPGQLVLPDRSGRAFVEEFPLEEKWL